jgi:hypothetical protein
MEDTKKNVAATPAPVKEAVKAVAKPKTTKKVAKKKPQKLIIQTNLARGFFLTGLLGILFFGLMVYDQLAWLNVDIEAFFENDVELLQTSVALFLIGMFSFTRK